MASLRSVTSLRATLAVVALLTLLALTSPSAHAQEYVELDPELDARAATLYSGIMCPQCNGQTISQSHAPIAETMRLMIRERLAAGDSDDAIYAFMVGAFGESILASPPKSGIALAVWLIPPAALLLGAALVAIVVRRMRQAAAAGPESSGGAATAQASGRGLDAYLSLVDREMETGRQQPEEEKGS